MSGVLAPAGPGGTEAVLLDMGGVLLDTLNPRCLPAGAADRAGRLLLLELLTRRGGTVVEEQLDELLFAPWRREYRERNRRRREADWTPHLERLLAATEARATGVEVLAAWSAPYREGLRPVAGAVEGLAALGRSGACLALVSNVPLPGILFRPVLARWELDQGLEVFCFSYDMGSRKPAPDMLLAAFDRLGVEPARVVMVGDRRESDVEAGRAAGCRTAWIRGGSIQGPEPDVTIGGLPELATLLAAPDRTSR